MDSNLKKKIKVLEWVTIAWNIFEGIASITAGIMAGSVSLIAYGLGSGMEVFASGVVLWEQNGMGKNRERSALKLIGIGYFFVAAYVYWNAFTSIMAQHHALPSPFGVILLIATVFMMFSLAYKKMKIGKQLQSPTILAEANFTFIDGMLAAAVLVGLILNQLFAWWWADQVIALIIGTFAIKEGLEEWKLKDIIGKIIRR